MSDEIALHITVKGKEYRLTPPFTNRELHVIKQVAGVRAAEFESALQAGDTDMLVALAHIAVRRAGSPRPTLDDLWDLPAGAIDVDVPDADEDEGSDPTPAADAANGQAGSPVTTPSPVGDPSTATSSV